VSYSCAGFDLVRNARDSPSQMDSSQHFGPNQAKVGEEIRDPGLCCVLKFLRVLGRTVIDTSG
jgi:hypothetical protein